MASKSKLSDSDSQLFREHLGDVKQLRQDKIHVEPRTSKEKKHHSYAKKQQGKNSFFFSDEFVPHFPEGKAISFVKEGEDSFEPKKLRRGEYYPELILDLHGLNQEQAKKEIAGLIDECIKKHFECACVIHGIGSHILKTKTPHWLVQHPNVIAFHQAPLEWGGQGALLLLIR